MKMKKIMSAIVAGAMAATMVMSANAATNIFSEDGSWVSNNEFLGNTSAEFDGINFGTLGLTSVTFHANCTDLNWGWNNGQFNSNSNNGGWQQVSFGGTESNADVVLTETGAFDVTVPVEPNDGGWFNIGWGTGCTEGIFSIDSIDFFAGDTKLGTWADGVWTEAKEETKLEPFVLYSQKTAVVDGKYSVRYVEMITEEEAKAVSSATLTLNNGSVDVPVKVTKYYTSVSAAGETITPDEGYVFLAYAVKNVPEDVTITAEGYLF
ncbi:MAG: hypothetical protein Q4E74_01920 [Ruminococcus sp.]|nr:hypothetical protein [Ruminococcus sp.]